jgi:uncharacterized pyridoxal phosphate-containing UPF0001 family protein
MEITITLQRFELVEERRITLHFKGSIQDAKRKALNKWDEAESVGNVVLKEEIRAVYEGMNFEGW